MLPPVHGNPRDTEVVTTVTTVAVQRSGPAIRAALAEHSPQECTQFEDQLQDALTQASADLDVSRIDEVLDRWHRRAIVAANPLTVAEHELLRQAQAGDLSGLRTRDDGGAWTTL